MIITTLGSMGTCKSALLIHMYLNIYKNLGNITSLVYTAHDSGRFKSLPTCGDRVKVKSRILGEIPAEFINEKAVSLKKEEGKKSVHFIDECTFIDPRQFGKDYNFEKINIFEENKKRGSDEIIYNFGLNSTFENRMWPSARKVCKYSDFIYSLDGYDKETNEIIDTNYMFSNNKFQLIYDLAVKNEFAACSKKFWYENAMKYFSEELEKNNFDVKEMLKNKPKLLVPFLKSFNMWCEETKKPENQPNTL